MGDTSGLSQNWGPGSVVIASVLNGIESRDPRRKPRPAVLVARDGGGWWAMGLTTQSHGRTEGMPRIPVPNPMAVGLNRPGWLWSHRLVKISALDVERRVGTVDVDLAEEVIAHAGLGGQWAEELRRAACSR